MMVDSGFPLGCLGSYTGLLRAWSSQGLRVAAPGLFGVCFEKITILPQPCFGPQPNVIKSSLDLLKFSCHSFMLAPHEDGTYLLWHLTTRSILSRNVRNQLTRRDGGSSQDCWIGSKHKAIDESFEEKHEDKNDRSKLMTLERLY